MDTLSLLAIILALVGIIPVLTVAWRYRNEKVVPVGKRAFWAMALGLLGIAAFYSSGSTVFGPEWAHVLNKLLIIFIVILTTGIAVGVLIYNKTCLDAEGVEALDCGK